MNLNEVEKTIASPAVMKRMRGIVINRYKIPACDADGVLFDALTTAYEWWDSDKSASWLTAVFTALETTCRLYKRKHKHDYKFTEFSLDHEGEDNTNLERITHFKQLLPLVIKKIMDVEDEEKRCILICALFYGDNFNDISLNPTASRKMVERFRQELREEFGQELYWE